MQTPCRKRVDRIKWLIQLIESDLRNRSDDGRCECTSDRQPKPFICPSSSIVPPPDGHIVVDVLALARQPIHVLLVATGFYERLRKSVRVGVVTVGPWTLWPRVQVLRSALNRFDVNAGPSSNPRMCADVVGAGQLVIQLRGGQELRQESSVSGIRGVPPVTAHQSHSTVAARTRN